MVRERFNESFERLREQSNRLAGIKRSADNLDEIVDQRVELDRRRDEATSARKEIVSRYEAPAPDVVTPARAQQSNSRFGKVVGTIGGGLLIVAVLVGALLIRTLAAGFPLKLDQTVESVDQPEAGERCRWRVEATLRNDSEKTVTITYFSTVLDRQRSRAGDMTLPTLAPGETAVVAGTWLLQESDECPEADEIKHTNLTIGYTHAAANPQAPDQNRSVSRGF